MVTAIEGTHADFVRVTIQAHTLKRHVENMRDRVARGAMPEYAYASALDSLISRFIEGLQDE